eukprot:450457-Prymnesium_polylepis.1
MMKAVVRVVSYSSESHGRLRSAYRYRREVSLSYSKVSHRKALKSLLDVLGSTKKVRPSISGNTRCSAVRTQCGANEIRSVSEYDAQGPGRANPDACAVVAKASGVHLEDALKLGRQLEEAGPLGVILEPNRRPHIIHARHRSHTLVEAHQRLVLVPHPRLLPDHPSVAHQAEQGTAGFAKVVEVADDDGAPAHRSSEDEKQRHTRCDDGSSGHIATIVAARLQLVKLAPRPAVALSAVAVAIGTSIGAAFAGCPAPIRLAGLRLSRRRRVAPVASRQVECHDGGVGTADNTGDPLAWHTLALRRVGVRAVVVLSAHGLWMRRPLLADKTQRAGSANRAGNGGRCSTGTLPTRVWGGSTPSLQEDAAFTTKGLDILLANIVASSAAFGYHRSLAAELPRRAARRRRCKCTLGT